jgi:hypothetical protein
MEKENPMRGDVDPRLVEFLKGAIGLADALRLIGITGPQCFSLQREDGLRLLELVAGASDEEAENFSQRGRGGRPGWNSLKVAGLLFEWPGIYLRARDAANDNDGNLHGVEWFEDYIPAMG